LLTPGVVAGLVVVGGNGRLSLVPHSIHAQR
jgi:hypothetical protein